MILLLKKIIFIPLYIVLFPVFLVVAFVRATRDLVVKMAWDIKVLLRCDR